MKIWLLLSNVTKNLSIVYETIQFFKIKLKIKNKINFGLVLTYMYMYLY